MRNSRWMLVGAVALLVVALAFFGLRFARTSYSASATVADNSPAQPLRLRQAATGAIGALALYDDPQFNRDLDGESADRLNSSLRPSEALREAIVDAVLAHVLVRRRANSVVEFSLATDEAAKSVSIVNAFADAYVAARGEDMRANPAPAPRPSQAELDRLGERMRADQAALRRYRAQHVDELSVYGSEFALRQVEAIAAQLVLARAELAGKQAVEDRTHRSGADAGKPPATDVVSNAVFAARAEVAALEQSLAGARRQADAERRAHAGLAALNAKARSSRRAYESALARQGESRSDAPTQPRARVVSYAREAVRVSGLPHSLILALSVPLGVLAGLLVAMLLGRDEDAGTQRVEPALAFRSQSAAADGLANRAARSIPRLVAEFNGVFAEGAVDAALDQPRSAFAQRMRALLDRLRATGAGRCVVVAVTNPEGGAKTVLAVSLARAAARAGLRTAVVDADLRRPLSARVMRACRAGPGLIETLNGAAPLSSALRRDARSNASVLAATWTPRDPAAVLSSRRMAELVGRLRRSLDVVIIDAPALSSEAEARAASTLCDVMLIVTRGGAPSGLEAQAIARFAAATGKRSGLVVAR